VTIVRRRSAPGVGAVVRFLVVVGIAAVIAFPIYTSFVSAVTLNGEIARHGLVPGLGSLTLANFAEVFRSVDLVPQYMVSIAVVTLQTSAQVITGALAAYALVFPRWRGKGLAFALVLLTLAIPGESIVIPNYELVSEIGLRDTVLGVALPYLAAGYPIFLLRQAFAGVPLEIWEASKLDGAGDLRSLFEIILPACRPEVTTAVVWSALSAWNGFFWPLLITDSASSRTIQVGISQLAASEASNPSVLFAGTVLVVIPTMLLVILAQRLLINGLARGVLH
jgi:ABC-type glycerol-3-phosphate transport system permease component